MPGLTRNDGLRKSRYMELPGLPTESLMERSFKKEVDALRLGAGEVFRGEGILAVTKALLQSGVSYVGGYQGAPVSHLLDVHGGCRGSAGRSRRSRRNLHQ